MSQEERLRLRLRDGVWSQGARAVARESAIAFVIDGGAEAVMMASPADLEDFAYGFALSEGLIASMEDVRDLEIAPLAGEHIEIRLWLKDGAAKAHATRRRRRAGPVGCGLCGVESIAEALPPLTPVVSDFRIGAEDLIAAVRALYPKQTLNEATRAAHAAAFYQPGAGILCVREDVGRHNALDKLIGALARQGRDCSGGVILMTSRVSVELIQKAAHARAPVLAAVSAPTSLALAMAETAGICVCAIVRDNGMEVFTHAERVLRDAD